MTKLLENAIEAARRLSPERQDEIARAILALTGEEDIADDEFEWVLPLLDEARASIRNGKGVSAEAFRAEIRQTISKLK